jgi:hypothetical protein
MNFGFNIFSRLLPLFLAWSLIHSAESAEVLVQSGSDWRFLDTGTDPGANWKNSDFDDQSWQNGNAPFGYGMDGLGSNLSYGNDPSNKHITSWFRRHFNVQKVNQFGNLKIRTRRDDGILIYVNGVEIFRDNLPQGPIGPQTLALVSITGQAQFEFLEITVPFELFQSGENCVAVEVHQSNSMSSDLVFDLELSGEIFSKPVFNKLSTWRYWSSALAAPVGWQNINFPDGNWPIGNGILGYGNENEATVLDFGPDPFNKYITTYFRKSFFVLPGQRQKIYMGQLMVDDGCIVYVNGIEVYRYNMPDGPVSNQTPAKLAIAGPDELVYHAFAFDSSLVVLGYNSISVEVHQSHPGSTDLSFDLALSGQRIYGGEIIRGPYLQSVSSAQAIVRWRTSRAVPSVLKWGIIPDLFNDSLMDPTPKTEHEMKMSDLVPSTKYYYQVGDGFLTLTHRSGNQFVKTNPVIGSEKPFRIWAIGDQGTIDLGQQRVREAFYQKNKSHHVDLMVTMGDNAYDGFDQNFQKALFETYPFTLENTPFWPGFGNHEGYGGANSLLQAGPFYDMFSLPKNGECGGVPSGTEAYYSFDYANVHFIHLNSHDIPKDSVGEMAQWLKNDLSQNQQMWTVAIWHHPPYSFGTHLSDGDSNMTQMRTQINPIIENFHVDLVLNGHSHVYERSFPIRGHFGPSATFLPNMKQSNQPGRYPADCGYKKKKRGEGTIYLTCGVSGQLGWGPLGYPSTAVDFVERGSLILDVEVNKFQIRFINEQGEGKDSLTIFKEVGKKHSLQICPGKVEKLVASWPGNHLWSNGDTTRTLQFQSDLPGQFTFSVSDGFGCLSDTFLVKVLEVPVLNLGPDTVLNPGETLLLSTNIPGQYLWNTGQTSSQISANANGKYWLQITLENGCVISDTLYTGLFSHQLFSEKSTGIRLIVFPNPSPSRINFKVSETEGPIRNIQVFDGTGRTISDVEFEGISQNSGHFQISKSGLFYVCFQFENGNSVWKKVAVTKI